MNKEELWEELKKRLLTATSEINIMIANDTNSGYRLKAKREGLNIAIAYINELEACLDEDSKFIYKNEAISRISDSSFTLGKVYSASQVLSNGTINLVDDQGQIITVDIDDKDFMFNLNIKQEKRQ